MTQQLRHEHTYAAPLDDVASMLGDPAFRHRVCEAQRVISCDVRVEPEGAGPKTVRVDQRQEARGLPSFAARIVGEQIQIVREEAWRSESHADLTLAIPGKPGDIAGTIELRESGGATTQTVSLRLSIPIPFVGAKVESLVADLLRKYFTAENEVGDAYLSA